MRASIEEIRKQNEFCGELASRLNKAVDDCVNDNFLYNHCQIQDDIKRLRRELMVLNKMFNWDWRQKEE